MQKHSPYGQFSPVGHLAPPPLWLFEQKHRDITDASIILEEGYILKYMLFLRIGQEEMMEEDEKMEEGRRVLVLTLTPLTCVTLLQIRKSLKS